MATAAAEMGGSIICTFYAPRIIFNSINIYTACYSAFLLYIFSNRSLCQLTLSFVSCKIGSTVHPPLPPWKSDEKIITDLSVKDNRVPCVGIQKHFMGAEILGFGLPNRFFGLTTSCFFRDGIVNWFTIKLNNLDLIIALLVRIEPKASECQSGLLT